MNSRLQRIQHTARRRPRSAVRLFAQLEAAAKNTAQYDLQLASLYLRYCIKERLGEAPAMLDELYHGLQLAETASLPLRAGQMLHALGRVCYTQGVYRDAIRHWTRCIDLCKLSQDLQALVEARIGLGQIYDAMGDWETGARFHRDAGTLLTQLAHPDPYLTSKQAINLAVNQLNIGQFDSARSLLMHARDQAQRAGITEYVAESHWHMGTLAMRQADLALAASEMAQASALARLGGNQWLQAAVLETQAEILTRQGQNHLALTTYLSALEHANQVDSRAQKAACCAALSRLYEQAGDALQALHYARRHQTLAAELAELSVADKFRELREYDLSRKPPAELLLDLSSSSALEEVGIAAALQLIADASIAILRIQYACIWLMPEPRNELVCHALSAPPGVPFAVGDGFSDSVLPGYVQVLGRSHTPLVAHDIRLHPAAAELLPLFAACPIRSLLELPLRMNGKHVGSISFAQYEQQRNWSREDVLFASHIRNLVQQVLAHAEHVQTQHELELRVAHRTQQLQQQTEQLEMAHRNIFLLSEIGRGITASLDRETIMSSVYSHVHELIKADAFAIGLYKPELGIIEFPCNMLNGQRLLPYQRDMNEPDLLSVWCITRQKEIYINDIDADYVHYIGVDGLQKLTTDSVYPDLTQKIYPLSHIYVPLQVKNKTIGLIVVQSTQKNAFQRMHVDMLMTLAAYAAVAIDNADAYQQLSSTQQVLMSKEKLAALGALVAGIAHELNTPLGNCVLTATTLQEQSNTFVQLMDAGQLKRSTLTQFTQTVCDANDLLIRNLVSASELVSSFKQVSVDQTSQQRRRFNLLATSHGIVRTLQSRIKKQGHRLHLNIPPDIDINSFPGPYGQVISNFIHNALLHAFEGREHGEMVLSAQKSGNDQVKIMFSDDGRGISAEHLRRIFEPFFTTKLGQGGSGLGLSIVHNIVTDLLGGNIEVNSTPGSGTHITLRLPLQS